jgi:hypothetical protein
MSAGFLEYFEKNLEKDIRKHLSAIVYSNFPVFSHSGCKPTTNLSEGLNNMLKIIMDRDQARFDAFILKALSSVISAFRI